MLQNVSTAKPAIIASTYSITSRQEENVVIEKETELHLVVKG